MRNFWNLTLSNFAGALFFLLCHSASAQLSKPDIELMEDNSYLFPIRPGNPASLAGTMGELRSTHFHTGIDIRTNSEIGWPVLAAKSGYISRAGVSGSGYGNVLYVKHPDGHTTVYGHLDSFSESVGQYVLKERYRRKTSAIDLYFRNSQFPVKKGDTIAFAGNTGSSAGPHLHFDIRNSNNLALNPLVYNFSEVRDHTSPIAQKIAFKTLDVNSRVNDRFGRYEFYLLRSGRDFILSQPILASGTIGIELLAHDIVDNTRFKCGVNHIEVYIDSVLVFKQNIEQLNLAQGRGIYTVMDFKKLLADGNRFYKLYQDDGNKLKFYTGSPGNGKLKIEEGKESNVQIVMKDFHNNTSTVQFRIKSTNPVDELLTLESARAELATEVEDNTLMVSAKPCSKEKLNAVVYSKGISTEIEPAYFNSVKAVYLVDLRKTLPDSVIVCDRSVITNLKAMIPSGIEYKYYSDLMDIRFPDRSLYDTVYFSVQHYIGSDSQEIFSLGPEVPFSGGISVTLKPTLPYSMDKKTAVYRVKGNSLSYEGGVWANGKLSFAPRELGDFTILYDTVPPTITRIYANNQAVRFKINDRMSGISTFEATINGKWLLLDYDAKTHAIVSRRLNPDELIKGDFELTVTDQAGNKKTYTQKIL